VFNLRSLLSILWLLLLIGYILAGVPITPFHGDEAMQITMSADYDTAFIQREPAALMVAPPYAIDSPAWLRLINGSVNRYLIGLSWHLAGFSVNDLPPIWQWPVSYDDNVGQGNRPSQALLIASRWPSALLLCMSVVVMFGIGYGVGGWPVALFTSGLYALHPVILLNGRRAMQEGALLCFGLLCIWLAMQIARRLHDRQRVSIGWWVGLALAAGLTLASKHSGLVFVAAAFGWVGVAILMGVLRVGTTRRIAPTVTQIRSAPLLLCLSAVIASLLLFLVLSPALWNDPPARLRDLLTERAALLDSQVIAAGGATTFFSRLTGMLTQPFLQPAEIYEAGFWANSSAFMGEVRAYTESAWLGLGGGQIGALFSAIALVGTGLLLFRLSRGDSAAWGLLVWLLVTLATLLINPLPWQRYYLPLLPITTLLAAWGGGWLLTRTRRYLNPRLPR
jgi:hypothetical protein